MKKVIGGVIFCLISNGAAFAAVLSCPDPQNSSLKWGVPPAPWQINPFSEHSPQGDENIKFIRANILVAGLGRGIVCAYQNALGEFSIWWPVLTKIPAEQDYNWIETLGGYVCTETRLNCLFSVATYE